MLLRTVYNHWEHPKWAIWNLVGVNYGWCLNGTHCCVLLHRIGSSRQISEWDERAGHLAGPLSNIFDPSRQTSKTLLAALWGCRPVKQLPPWAPIDSIKCSSTRAATWERWGFTGWNYNCAVSQKERSDAINLRITTGKFQRNYYHRKQLWKHIMPNECGQFVYLMFSLIQIYKLKLAC